MNLSVITPEKEILNMDQISYVHLILSNGYPISIYPNHARLIGKLMGGVINFSSDRKDHQIEVSKGIIKVEKNVIRCFVEDAKNIFEETTDEK